MDEQPTTAAAKPISDDQELAKALAGVSQTTDELDYEETSSSLPTPTPTATMTAPDATQATTQAAEQTYSPPATTPQPTTIAPTEVAGSEDLETIKKDALIELRPLVDKLDLSPEEKFDTYLLLLRSTDDKALVAPAHKAAQGIADETRRAQALLDIIKEIDYFSQPSQPAA